jgi:micrococcal nuclease|tara:strand:- start:323 stop:745 length:423 start_codon:yes stop_codon:yes gene_type:complete
MHEYKCTILRVVDGDTVDVDIDLGFGVWLRKERVRIHGIDTPESRTRDLTEKKYGLAAKQFVKEILLVGSQQRLLTEKDKTGKFGRILGKFLVHDVKEDREMHLGQIMIREHHAVEYSGQSKEDIGYEHIKNREFITIEE